MTPEEKAIELYNKMYETGFKPKSVLIRIEQAKECALIAANEILKENLEELPDEPETVVRYIYWQEVKQKIETIKNK
jgi:hypothetical protein